MSRRPVSVATMSTPVSWGARRVVDQRRSHNLAQSVGEKRRRDLDPLLLGHSEACDLGTERDPDEELRPSGGETHLLVAGHDRHRPRLEGAHDVDDEAGGHQHRPVGLTRDLAASLDHEIGIRSAHLQLCPP